MSFIALPFVILKLLSFESHSEFDDKAHLAIVYESKSLQSKVRAIYADIITGIRHGFGSNSVIEVNDGDLHGWSADSVIMLGNYVVREALAANNNLNMVVGAVSWVSETVHGIHITVDPALVFETVAELVPTVSEVFIILDANSRLLDISHLVASGEQQGINVRAILASDIKDAASIYSRLSIGLDAQHAFWIPPGDRFVNKALLSTLLLRSWQSGFAVISSNPSHVSKGALFALSPDYYLMGVRLGELAIKVFENPTMTAKMWPLRDVKLNINQRMANHMGIKIHSDIRQKSSNRSIQLQVQ